MDELRDDLLQRQWLVAEEGDDDDTPHLRIVQWNILADGKLFISILINLTVS